MHVEIVIRVAAKSLLCRDLYHMQHQVLTWEIFMGTIPWFFWDYLAEEGAAESSGNANLALPQMQFSRCDSCVGPSDVEILIYLLLFNKVALARWAAGKLEIVGDNWFSFVMSSHTSKKNPKTWALMNTNATEYFWYRLFFFRFANNTQLQ